MSLLAKIFVGIIAFEHFFILWIEVFAWTSKGPKVFSSFQKDFFTETKALASNMGLYNGFLAGGLIWSLLIANPEWAFNVALYFVICVVVAGIYGAFTVEKGIFFKQGVPGIIAMLFLLLA